MPKVTISKRFVFDAAHNLPLVPAGHKCAHLHGHTYSVELHVAGPITERGWIVDFDEIARAWEPCARLLDHRHLNMVGGLDNPTAEHLATFIWEHVKPRLPQLTRVVLSESSTTTCTYEGE